jgi:hypothetical protein
MQRYQCYPELLGVIAAVIVSLVPAFEINTFNISSHIVP